MGNKGRGEKTKMNKGRREGQGERANNNKEFSYVFVWCLFRSLIGPKSGQNPKKKKHPNLQPHLFFQNERKKRKKGEMEKKRVICIGDIHGHLDKLESLWEKLKEHLGEKELDSSVVCCNNLLMSCFVCNCW